MTNETKPIEPALSAEEWAGVPAEWETDRTPLTGIAISYTDGALHTGHLSNPYSPAQVIALTNHSLPDDSPHKITRADVEALQHVAVSECPYVFDDDEAAIRRLAAKLDALLPPEV